MSSLIMAFSCVVSCVVHYLESLQEHMSKLHWTYNALCLPSTCLEAVMNGNKKEWRARELEATYGSQENDRGRGIHRGEEK